jgi:hypothetical protein
MDNDDMNIVPAGVCRVAQDQAAIDRSWPSGMRHLLCHCADCPGPIDTEAGFICGLWGIRIDKR